VPGTFTAVVLTGAEDSLPAAIEGWLQDLGLSVAVIHSADQLMAWCLRGRPRIVLLDARVNSGIALEACERIKRDSYSGVVPTVLLCGNVEGEMERCFLAGADEVLTSSTQVVEDRSR
jgi:CheY-like chemotaxis protein